MDDEETVSTSPQEEARQENTNPEDGFPYPEIDVNSREENPILDMFG